MKTITDASAVQAFYKQTLALPHLSSSTGPTNGCSPYKVWYFLIFHHADHVNLYAELIPGGCATLTLTNVDTHVILDGRQPDQAYFDRLASLLGISPTQIRPTSGGYPTPTITSTP